MARKCPVPLLENEPFPLDQIKSSSPMKPSKRKDKRSLRKREKRKGGSEREREGEETLFEMKLVVRNSFFRMNLLNIPFPLKL